MVEGNIGCGKSTFLRYFQQLSPKNEVMHEPLYLWKDARGYDLFLSFHITVCSDLFDIKLATVIIGINILNQYAYWKGQSIAVGTVLQKICTISKSQKVFVSTGSISDADYEELLKIFQWILKNKSGPVDLIVYLRASPTVCFERLRARNRSGEEDIPLKYLEDLHELHEAWLIERRFGQLPAPLLPSSLTCGGLIYQETNLSANDYRLFVLGWLPNLRILDGTRITKEDIEKANCFISGIKSPLFIQSSSQSERSKSNEDTDKGILNRNSCSNEDHNHVFQSFSSSVIATTNSTPRNYPLNNTSMISSILNNGNIHLNQIKCNNKSTCTEGVNMSSLSYSSSPANPKLNINNINDNKSLFITHETSSYPMTNPQLLLKISTNSPRQVLPEIKEGLFKTKLIDDLCRMNSYCNDQLITSSNNLLSSDSVYLPLNVSNTTNKIEETFETGYKARSHSNAVHCTISDVKDWQSIDKKSLKLSPSDSLLSSGNFIPLHQSMYPQSPKLSHSLNNSLHSINSNENIKFETLGFINGVHLIHDGEENEEGDNNDDNINEEEDDIITETTVQSSRFIEHIDKPNNDEQSKEDSTITLNNNNIDEEDILVKGVLDDMDLTCLINLKHKISTQSLKVHNSITKDQENEIFDNNIKQQSVQSAEVNEDSKLAVNTDVNDDNHVESNSVATDRYNVTTTVLDNALINPITLNINKFSHNSNPVTLSSTSSMATSLSNYCPTCGNQTKLLQDHVIFLQKQLQNQCKSNEAESKLNQLHSNSIQFLLKEVQELKTWKESISLKLTNSIYKSIEFSSNSTQTDIQDHYYDQRNELIIENTLNNNVDLLNIKKSNDNNTNLNCIQLSNNIIEQNHMENANELKYVVLNYSNCVFCFHLCVIIKN
ncbi:unnamed protein product [Schistosoma margrebowiei]|uniref:Uncharacterized protein n=1 Tax=Schistosoma margrebowiei TaxID=48269 RepID=A0A183MLA8_9TREM|nr:unnamed protein product [Schistosoma margrebowiei]